MTGISTTNLRIDKMKRRMWPYFFCSFFLILYVLFSLYPTLYSFFISLHDWNGIKPMKYIGLANYTNLLFKDKEFWGSLGVTLRISLFAIVGQVIVGMLLAVILFNLNSRLKRIYQTVFFGPYIVSTVAIAIMMRYFFEWENGYLNGILNYVGILEEHIYWLQTEQCVVPILVFVNIWRSAGYSMVIFLASMTAIPEDIYAAAKVDGANGWQTFWHITIPELKPMIIFIVLTSIISGLQFFELPSLMYASATRVEGGSLGGPNHAAFTVMWKFYADTFQRKMRLGYGAATTYVLFILILGVTIISNLITGRKEDE